MWVYIIYCFMFISDYILEDMISYGYLSKIMIIYVYFMSE